MFLIGHEWALECLYRQWQAGKLRRSHLFLGPRRVGKTTLALAFAMRLQCERPEGPWPCGECRACRRIRARSHPDAIVIEPAGSTFTVEQVRDLERELPLSPLESELKVRILADFDLASREAQNALLKTLEEPPGHALLVLTAANCESLAPTISSRCQVWRLRPVPAESIRSALVAQGVGQQEAQVLSQEALGCPGYALAAAAQPQVRKARAEAFQLAEQLLGQRRYERFASLGPLARRPRQEVLSVLLLWQLWWRTRLLELAQGTQPEGGGLTLRQAARFLRELQQAELALMRNANVRLVLDLLAVRMPILPKGSAASASTKDTLRAGN